MRPFVEQKMKKVDFNINNMQKQMHISCSKTIKADLDEICLP